MPHTTTATTKAADSTFEVLHAIRIKGFAPTEVISAIAGLPATRLNLVLADLQDRQLATYKEGRISGWRLTPAGTEAHAVALDTYREGADMPGIEAFHVDFRPLNARVKQLCTDWQLRDGSVNDHSDAIYDRRVVLDATALQDDVDRTLASAESAFTRVRWYRGRLADANSRFAAGDGAALARPLSNSYHDVWMELHEDLIVTLGAARTDADA